MNYMHVKSKPNKYLSIEFESIAFAVLPTICYSMVLHKQVAVPKSANRLVNCVPLGLASS